MPWSHRAMSRDHSAVAFGRHAARCGHSFKPALAALALAVTPAVLPGHAGAAAKTLTVTTTADLPSPCAPAAFSLRCAFEQANADVSGDTIAFNIPSTDPGCVTSVIQQTMVAVCTIFPVNTHFQGGLPALIVNNTTIDGYTQPGALPNSNPMSQGDNAIITIRLDGTKGDGFLTDGIQILSNNTVRGLSITNFAQGMGVRIDQGFAKTLAAHNVIAGDFLGVAPDGTSGGSSINNVDLDIRTGADRVGGTRPADANVIGGGVPNEGIGNLAGVYINAGVSDTPGSGANDVIQGNYIGTNAAGTAVLGNGPSGFQTGNGVQISGAFLVGGASAAARNVISGNANAGVAIPNGTSGAVVEGNYIGANAAGTAALGNGNGIAFPQDFIIAGPTAHNTVARNLIAGNLGDGIADQAPSRGNIFAGNTIGLSATGAALGNAGNGVNLTLNGSFLSGPIEDDVVSNTIMHNGRSGVLVGQLAHSLLSRNVIAANGGLGIDLAPQGVVNCATPPPGPNDYTPCPIITTATTTTIAGTACISCTVEVYIAASAVDDQGHGEGKVFVGSATADGAGAWSLGLPAGTVTPGQQVTASATTQATPSIPAETSEFGANLTVASSQ